MASVNLAILIGRLGKPPALNYTPNGNAVCKFSIATVDGWKDSQGEKHEKVTWHNIVFWGKAGEAASKYLSKGSLVYVEGKIDNRSYDDKDGNKKYVTEIIGSVLQFLDTKKAADPMDQRPAQESFNQAPITADEMPEERNHTLGAINDDLPF
jgi:single stranded DNA-binding protein (ssb)